MIRPLISKACYEEILYKIYIQNFKISIDHVRDDSCDI